ncbi:MAG: hypothetical protein AB1815_10615 [Bacillota bacterium]|jgi:hypothetical protein
MGDVTGYAASFANDNAVPPPGLLNAYQKTKMPGIIQAFDEIHNYAAITVNSFLNIGLRQKAGEHGS